MGNGYLYRRRAPATPGDLAELLQRQPGTPAWRLQEEIDALEFELADADWLATLPAGLWSQGRVFGPQAEVRWETADGGSYDVLVLSETQLSLSADDWSEQPMAVGKVYDLYLWGERKKENKEGKEDEYWIETRIPRPLRYPLDEAEWQRQPLPYAAAEALDYAQNGVVRLTRLVRLKPADGTQGGGDDG